MDKSKAFNEGVVTLRGRQSGLLAVSFNIPIRRASSLVGKGKPRGHWMIRPKAQRGRRDKKEQFWGLATL